MSRTASLLWSEIGAQRVLKAGKNHQTVRPCQWDAVCVGSKLACLHFFSHAIPRPLHQRASTCINSHCAVRTMADVRASSHKTSSRRIYCPAGLQNYLASSASDELCESNYKVWSVDGLSIAQRCVHPYHWSPQKTRF